MTITEAICNEGFSGLFNHSFSLQHFQFVFDDWRKKEIMNKRIGSVQFESEVLRTPSLNIAETSQKSRKMDYVVNFH